MRPECSAVIKSCVHLDKEKWGRRCWNGLQLLIVHTKRVIFTTPRKMVATPCKARSCCLLLSLLLVSIFWSLWCFCLFLDGAAVISQTTRLVFANHELIPFHGWLFFFVFLGDPLWDAQMVGFFSWEFWEKLFWLTNSAEEFNHQPFLFVYFSQVSNVRSFWGWDLFD